MRREKLRVGLLGAGAAAILTVGATWAHVQSGAYTSAKAESLQQTVSPEAGADGKYLAGSYASAPPELAEGDGKSETESFCAMCHSTRYITMQPPLPAATWEAEVNKMVKTFGAPIPEAAAKKITSYLQAHYTPENRKY